MQTRFRYLAAISAIAATLQPLPSLAQQRQCVRQDDISALAVYIVPLALEAVQQRCSASASPDGFFATGASAMIARYAALADAAWPRALAAIHIFARRDGEMRDFLKASPQELRPLLDAYLQAKIVEDLPLQDCRQIERVAEALAPLDPAAAANAAAVIASVAGVDNPSICPEQE